MAVNVGQRNVPITNFTMKLDAGTEAEALAVHTFKLVSNKKIFLVKYDRLLNDDIVICAKNIYLYVCEANDIRVEDSITYDQRIFNQELAIQNCNKLLRLISLARRTYHLKGKKVAFWQSMVFKTKTAIAGWSASDKERYKKYKNKFGM